MKANLLLFCLLFTFGINVTVAKAQAFNVDDSLALVDIYNTNNGPNWSNHTNWLSGPVSTWSNLEIGDNRVTALILGYNNLSGVLSPSIGKLTELIYLYLNNNRLKGGLPVSIGNLQHLYEFQGQKNHFSGHLPPAFGGLTSLISLNLSYNELTGPIPLTFKDIPFQLLSLEYNHLKQERNIPFNRHTYGDLSYVKIYDNDFNFDGLEFLQEAVVPHKRAFYSPQAPLQLHQNGNSLSVYAGGTLGNNTYKWFKVGETNPTTIVGDSTFTPAQSGMYYAQITNAIAVKLTLYTDTITYTMPAMASRLSVYPNPVKDILTVTGLDAKNISKITVTNYAGNVFFSAIAQYQSAAKYNAGRLQPGNYLLNVSDGNKVSTVKFVKE